MIMFQPPNCPLLARPFLPSSGGLGPGNLGPGGVTVVHGTFPEQGARLIAGGLIPPPPIIPFPGPNLGVRPALPIPVPGGD